MSGHFRSMLFPDLDHGIGARKAGTELRACYLTRYQAYDRKGEERHGYLDDGSYLMHCIAKSCLRRLNFLFPTAMVCNVSFATPADSNPSSCPQSIPRGQEL